MSEYITHIAVQEDTVRLAIHADEICDAFKLCFKEHNKAARMGSSSRGNSTFVVQNLQHFRDKWETRKPNDRIEDKLAFTLGWITHRAADRFFKPKYGIFDKNPNNLHPVDIRIYHDVVLYEKVYNSGAREPFSKGFAQKNMKTHPGAKGFSLTKAEALFSPMYQSEILSLQSFDTVKNGAEFLKRVEDEFPTFTVDFDRFIEGVNNPDEENMQQMITEPNFYDEKDPIIKTARNLQEGKPVAKASVLDMLNTAKQSQYAQVLGQSFKWIYEASQYFDRANEKDEEYLYDTYLIAENQKIKRY